MIRKTATYLGMALLAIAIVAVSARAEVKIGIGVIGPISPQTEADIEKLVGDLPNVKAVPIQPPGDVDACVALSGSPCARQVS